MSRRPGPKPKPVQPRSGASRNRTATRNDPTGNPDLADKSAGILTGGIKTAMFHKALEGEYYVDEDKIKVEKKDYLLKLNKIFENFENNYNDGSEKIVKSISEVELNWEHTFGFYNALRNNMSSIESKEAVEDVLVPLLYFALRTILNRSKSDKLAPQVEAKMREMIINRHPEYTFWEECNEESVVRSILKCTLQLVVKMMQDEHAEIQKNLLISQQKKSLVEIPKSSKNIFKDFKDKAKEMEKERKEKEVKQKKQCENLRNSCDKIPILSEVCELFVGQSKAGQPAQAFALIQLALLNLPKPPSSELESAQAKVCAKIDAFLDNATKDLVKEPLMGQIESEVSEAYI